MNWYRYEKVNAHITRIIDIAGVCCYLIEGEDKACLLDTCCGYGDLKAFVQGLTNKEVFVILTHGHYDHIGCASSFEEVYMHHDELPVLHKHVLQREYFLEIDRQSIPSLKNIEMKDLMPLYQKLPSKVEDGQIFNLGNLHLKLIQVKGHTPGMMCALLEEDRVMFYGDACGMNVLLHDEYASCVSEYKTSLEKLKQYDQDYDLVLRNHGSYTNGKALLDNVINCCELILRGEDDHHPIEMFDQILFEAKERKDGRRIDGKEGNIIYALDKQK